ncbi:MAG: DinB family protein, partial [Verrucomicrobiota bacterium]
MAWASNNAWANRRFYQALGGLEEGAFIAERPGFFPSLSETMNHILIVDLYYVDALTRGGKGRKIFERDDLTAPARLAAEQAECDARLLQVCMDASEADLSTEITIERRDGPSTEAVKDVLPHLFQHQIHHRGQAHVQLQHAGIDPPQLDDFFLR